MLKRLKRRYLAIGIDSIDTFGSAEFMESAWQSIMTLYGEHGASQANLKLIDYDADGKFAVLRTSNLALDMTRAALASVTKIGNKPAALHVLSVSGTIRSLQKKGISARKQWKTQ